MVTSIKLDLSACEQVVRPTVLRRIAHAYPDTLPEPATVRCYSFEEVFAEKIRAMGERGRPRDLYDIVHLFRRTDLRDHPKLTHDVLTEKCRTKGVSIPTIASLESSGVRVELESEWSNMLAHQLPALPALADFWKDLPRLFAWLEGTYAEEELPAVGAPVHEEIDAGWSPAPTITTWGAAVPVETIRFAAVNHLCVDLGYQGTTRVVEPYSLRRTKARHLLLYAVRADTREPRAYRVDRIQSARVTNRTFQPVYRVEFSGAGVLHAPPISRASSMTPRAHTGSRAWRGVVYIIACPHCQKEFHRRRAGDTRLREHKTRAGLRCPGSRNRGYVTDTRYE